MTASPQLMKTLLARGAGDEGLDAVPEVKRATASGGESMIGYLEPSALMSTLFSVYEMGSPLVESGLARQRITVRMPELPAASAVMPHVRPSATVVRRVKGPGGGLTTFQVLRGEKSAFPKDAEGLQLGAISDGTSRTFAVVEVSGERAVPWTKPEDLAFDPDKPFDGLGTDRRPGGLFIAAFLDGHVETLSPDVPPRY